MNSSSTYDAIVIGLGAMGGAATYHLARRGLRVLGIEMFQPGHDQGSSHGHHRMSSPRHHVPKVYEVDTKHPLDDRQIARLLAGVVLDDDPRPVKAAACEAVAPQHLRLTLTEGKYHQVKRMLAAVGNRVEALHRSQIGALKLPDTLAPGQWSWLGPEELALIRP